MHVQNSLIIRHYHSGLVLVYVLKLNCNSCMTIVCFCLLQETVFAPVALSLSSWKEDCLWSFIIQREDNIRDVLLGKAHFEIYKTQIWNVITCWFEHWTLRSSHSVNLVFQIIHEPPPPVSDESSVSSAFISHPNGFEYWGKNKETRSNFYNVGKSGHRWEGSASSGMFFGLNICLISHSNYFKTVTNVQAN